MNVFITTEILKCEIQSRTDNDKEIKYSFNSNIGNTLELDIEKKWNINKFDAIIGNPPYQAVDENGKSKGGGNNLYTKFIYKSDEILNDDGYLLFINPPTFFGIGRSNNKDDMNVRKDILNNYYFNFMNLEECSKYFNVGSKFIYYLIQKNKKINKKINVICKFNNIIYKSKIDQEILNNMDYLPYLMTNESITILNKIKNNENKKIIIFHSPDNRGDKKHVKKTKNDEFKYPIQATGSQILYSSKPCKNQTDKKILMSESGYLNPFYDNGINGVGGHCFSVIVKDEKEGNYIIKLLNSKLYRFYIEINKWSGFHHRKVLQDLPYIKLDENFNDNDIYKYFKLTNEEIEFLEKINIMEYKNINNIQDKIIKRVKSSKVIKKSVSSKIQKETNNTESDSDDEKKIIKVKKNNNILNKTK